MIVFTAVCVGAASWLLFDKDDQIPDELLLATNAGLTLTVIVIWASKCACKSKGALEFRDACTGVCALSALALAPRAWQLRFSNDSVDDMSVWVAMVLLATSSLPLAAFSYCESVGQWVNITTETGTSNKEISVQKLSDAASAMENAPLMKEALNFKGEWVV